jgi:hypothetical protein
VGSCELETAFRPATRPSISVSGCDHRNSG